MWLFAMAQYRILSNGVDPRILKKLITIDDGGTVNREDYWPN